jgi:hypothetical protein
MDKPSVFIGSSSEGLHFARASRSLLNSEAEVTMWNEDFFKLGNTFIETLVYELPRFDFAILILTPDDWITSRETKALSPRDNILFELGLFMGYLGRSRTFIMHQTNPKLKLPSDLSGVTTATYDWPRKDNSYTSAVGAACDNIRKIIHDLGVSDNKVIKHVNEMKSRQDFAEKRIVDAENKINRLFAYTMSESMFSNLRKLASGNFGPFINNGGLRRELRHLRDIGYIKSLRHIGDIPKEGANLSEFIKITDVGSQFVEFRNSLESADD